MIYEQIHNPIKFTTQKYCNYCNLKFIKRQSLTVRTQYSVITDKHEGFKALAELRGRDSKGLEPQILMETIPAGWPNKGKNP